MKIWVMSNNLGILRSFILALSLSEDRKFFVLKSMSLSVVCFASGGCGPKVRLFLKGILRWYSDLQVADVDFPSYSEKAFFLRFLGY